MTYPAWAWDTSGKTPRRVRVGETISYGGGKVPEPRLDVASQVAKLVREARQKYNDSLPTRWKGGALGGHRQILDWYGYLELCDALEEMEREVECLRMELASALNVRDWLLQAVSKADREERG